MLSRILKSLRLARTSTPARASSRRRKFTPLVETLEKRELLSATNPTAGVLWTEQISFHGHYDSSQIPVASDFEVTINWGDGTSTVATNITEEGNTDEFTATATHTYTTPGNTPQLFEVDITNTHDNLTWLQVEHGVTVDAAPSVTQGQATGEQSPQAQITPIAVSPYSVSVSTTPSAADSSSPSAASQGTGEAAQTSGTDIGSGQPAPATAPASGTPTADTSDPTANAPASNNTAENVQLVAPSQDDTSQPAQPQNDQTPASPAPETNVVPPQNVSLAPAASQGTGEAAQTSGTDIGSGQPAPVTAPASGTPTADTTSNGRDNSYSGNVQVVAPSQDDTSQPAQLQNPQTAASPASETSGTDIGSGQPAPVTAPASGTPTADTSYSTTNAPASNDPETAAQQDGSSTSAPSPTASAPVQLNGEVSMKATPPVTSLQDQLAKAATKLGIQMDGVVNTITDAVTPGVQLLGWYFVGVGKGAIQMGVDTANLAADAVASVATQKLYGSVAALGSAVQSAVQNPGAAVGNAVAAVQQAGNSINNSLQSGNYAKAGEQLGQAVVNTVATMEGGVGLAKTAGTVAGAVTKAAGKLLPGLVDSAGTLNAGATAAAPGGLAGTVTQDIAQTEQRLSKTTGSSASGSQTPSAKPGQQPAAATTPGLQGMVDQTIQVAGPAGKFGDLLKAQITQDLNNNPVAAKAFKEIHDAGIDIVLDTTQTPPPGVAGATSFVQNTGQATKVTIYVNNHESPANIAGNLVTTIAHESKHVQMGQPLNSLYEEYFAHVREALSQNGGSKLTPDQRTALWQQVIQNYYSDYLQGNLQVAPNGLNIRPQGVTSGKAGLPGKP